MKLKSWIVWLLVAAFLASVFFLFSANSQKVAALESASELKQQAADLQAQLDQLKSSIADSQNVELSRLHADNQDLPRLRNQLTLLQATNATLHAANQKLTQQLQAILTTAQQQQVQLEQAVVEKRQARVAAQQADEESARNACINHLRQIDAAKNQWALENNKAEGAVPTAQDIAPYIKLDADGNIPGCPSGGTYTIGAVGVPPSCSIPGHVLP
jgi:hypothetical protein